MNHFESVDKITSAWDSSWHDNNCVYIMHCISNSKFCTPTASALPFNLSVPGSLSLSQSGGSEHDENTTRGRLQGHHMAVQTAGYHALFCCIYPIHIESHSCIYVCWLLQFQYGPCHTPPAAGPEPHSGRSGELSLPDPSSSLKLVHLFLCVIHTVRMTELHSVPPVFLKKQLGDGPLSRAVRPGQLQIRVVSELTLIGGAPCV